MAKNTITPFGQEVKDALKVKGITQGDLAEKLGVTKQYLYNILYGMKPGRRHLPMIAQICEISMEPDSADTDKSGEPCEENKEAVDETGRDIQETPKTGETQKESHPLTPFGVMVVEALDRMGMKQVELARQVGTGKQYLYMILHGMRSGRKYLPAIAQICEIDLELDTEDTKKGGEPCEKSKEPVKETIGDIQEIPESEENDQ